MSITPTDLRCRGTYFRSNGSPSQRHSSDLIPFDGQNTRVRPRVLIVEFRDEVYGGLKTLLEEHGFEVERTECGATVARAFNRFVPDLLLVNEDMPDESGWLITCKLRLTRRWQPVWLYTVRQPRFKADWKEYVGVDEVIDYGGVLIRLVRHVQQLVADRLGRTDGRPPHQQLNSAATSLVA